MRKICPTCRRQYTALENFCTKCGIELVKEPNHCSANKTALCKEREREEDDLYCPYCGAKTTYALRMIDGDW